MINLLRSVLSSQAKEEESDGDENQFVMAVTVKDEDGNIDLDAIAESEFHF